MSLAPDPTTSEDAASSVPPIVVGATRAEEARQLLAVVAPVARARGARLILVFVSMGGPGDASEPPDEAAPDEDLLPANLSSLVTVLRYRTGPDVAFRSAAMQHGASLLVLGWSSVDEDPEDEDGTEERHVSRTTRRRIRQLFLDPPCEAWLVRGRLGGRAVRSVLLVPPLSASSSRTLDAARSLAPEGSRLSVLDVRGKDSDPPDADLTESLSTGLGDREHEIIPVTAPSRERAALRELSEHGYDLVLTETVSAGILPFVAAPSIPVDLIERVEAPIVVVNGPQSRRAVTLRRWWNRVYLWTESLDDEQRIRVYSDLRRSARADRDFLALTVAATTIAALGLMLDSVAVIIGAMLVAPLMAPLIALGLAIVFGDARFMRVSGGAIVRGTLVAYPVAAALGILVPQVDLGDEILARTEPSGLDLLVGIVSGAAGAYAYARRDISAALPGVAIAAALVPPLAASAIAFGSGEFEEAAGAGLLYVLNVAAISAAAAVVFLWFGFRPEAQRLGRVRAFSRGFAAIVGLIVVVAGTVLVLGREDSDVARLERSVTGVVEGWLPSDDALEEIEVDDRGGEVGVRVRMESALPRGGDSAEMLATLIADELGRPVVVDLVVVPIVHGTATPVGEPPEGATAESASGGR